MMLDTTVTRDGINEAGVAVTAPWIVNKDATVIPQKHPRINKALDEVRDYLNVPMVRTDGYRPATHDLEKGKKNPGQGPHTIDGGTDFRMEGVSQFEQVLAVERNPVLREGGRGLYVGDTVHTRGHLHVDDGDKRDWAFINNPDGTRTKIPYEDAIKLLPDYNEEALKAARSGGSTPGYAPYFGPPTPLGDETKEYADAKEIESNAALDMMGLSPQAQEFIIEEAEMLGRTLSYPGNRERSVLATSYLHFRGEQNQDFPEELPTPDLLNFVTREMGIKGENGEYMDWNESRLKDFKMNPNRNFLEQLNDAMVIANQEYLRLATTMAVDTATDTVLGGLALFSAVYKSSKGLATVATAAMSRLVFAWGAAKKAGVVTEGASAAQKMKEVTAFADKARETGKWTKEFGQDINARLEGLQAAHRTRMENFKNYPHDDEGITQAAAELNAAEGGNAAEKILNRTKTGESLSATESRVIESYLIELNETGGKLASKMLRTEDPADAEAFFSFLLDNEYNLARLEAAKTNMGLGMKQLDAMKENLSRLKVENLTKAYEEGGLDLSLIAMWMTQNCRR